MGMGVAGLFVAFVFVSPSRAEEAEDGLIGIAFDAVPEGAVVRSVRSGMGADKVGLRVGDLVTSLDGEPVAETTRAAAKQFRGAIGSTLRAEVQGPLSTEKRTVEVLRGERVPAKRSPRMDPVLARFRATVRTEKKPAAARVATEALIAAQFTGMSPSEAVGTALSRAARKQPKVARAVLELLSEVAKEDGAFRQRIGDAWFVLGEYALAAAELAKGAELLGADIRGDEFRGNAGSDHRKRELLVNSLWDTGDKDAAIAQANELAALRDIPGLWGHVGIPSPKPRVPMMARLPPVPDYSTTLLDGAAWSSDEQEDKIVLLAFWATWCGPCKREMPELAEMWEGLHGKPFSLIAVSVDEGSSDKVAKTAKKWGMPFSVAHDRKLGQRFEVSGLPAIRLLGPDGAMRFSGSGYSTDGVEKLSKRVEKLLEEMAGGEGGDGQRVGDVWTRGTAELTGFTVVSGAISVGAGDDQVVVGAKGAAPIVLPIVGGEVGTERERDVSTKWSGIAGEVRWFDGAVGAHRERLWIRAFDPSGDQRWFRTLPSPLVQMVVSGDLLWVAMDKGLVALDTQGVVVAQHDVDAVDIAAADDGGVWAVDGQTRYLVKTSGVVSSDAAPGGQVVDGGGTWGREGFTQLVQGRFGPEGALRKVVVREDETVIGLDGAGTPAFHLKLEADPVVAVIDVDGDGRDELLVTIARHGVATLKLELP
jgi:thiol-disulfide isomerase/thioredoxin